MQLIIDDNDLEQFDIIDNFEEWSHLEDAIRSRPAGPPKTIKFGVDNTLQGYGKVSKNGGSKPYIWINLDLALNGRMVTLANGAPGKISEKDVLAIAAHELAHIAYPGAVATGGRHDMPSGRYGDTSFNEMLVELAEADGFPIGKDDLMGT